MYTTAPDSELFESGAQDYRRKGDATAERCMHQAVTGEKAKIRIAIRYRKLSS